MRVCTRLHLSLLRLLAAAVARDSSIDLVWSSSTAADGFHDFAIGTNASLGDVIGQAVPLQVLAQPLPHGVNEGHIVGLGS
jgi:hypothetical protein